MCKRFKIYRRIPTANNNELLVHEYWKNLFQFDFFFAIDVNVTFIDQQNKKKCILKTAQQSGSSMSSTEKKIQLAECVAKCVNL